MGLLQTLGLRKKDVEAQLSPPIMSQTYGAGVYTFGGLFNSSGIPFIDRNLALQVPSVSRCRNLNLWRYRKYRFRANTKKYRA
jgi:hypothetical protein